jgi:hypothetical protein
VARSAQVTLSLVVARDSSAVTKRKDLSTWFGKAVVKTSQHQKKYINTANQVLKLFIYLFTDNAYS